MRSFLSRAILTIFLSGCTPTACNDDDERLYREVEVLIQESGPLAKEAKRRLVERGASAIVILETGLYSANHLGRRRIIDVLEAIGDPEVRPILRHLAERDLDADVRRRAGEALRTLEGSISLE